MATWTLEQITDAIMNNVVDGLQGSPNSPIPREQLKADVILLRNILLENGTNADGNVCKKSAGFANAEQQINCIEVVMSDPSECCTPTGETSVPVAMVPTTLIFQGKPALSFVGLSGRSGFGWGVYYGEGYKTHKYSVGIKTRPYIVVYPPKNGYHSIYLFNLTTELVAELVAKTKKLSVTGVFVDPFAKYDFSCCAISGDPEDTVEFPASETIIVKIVDTLSQKYITYYRQGNAPVQNNDQTDKVT